MKKVLLGFVLIGMLSCSKNDDDNSTPASGNIVSKWHLIDILENGKPISGYSCNKEFDIAEFTSSGQSITKYSDKDSKNICVQYTDNGTYTVSDNILTDTQKYGSIKIYEAKYKIKELTSTTLKLETISTFEADNKGLNPYTENYSAGEEVKVYNKIN